MLTLFLIVTVISILLIVLAVFIVFQDMRSAFENADFWSIFGG
jgi:hypothetical protein